MFFTLSTILAVGFFDSAIARNVQPTAQIDCETDPDCDCTACSRSIMCMRTIRP